jgi:hypothetical protein
VRRLDRPRIGLRLRCFCGSESRRAFADAHCKCVLLHVSRSIRCEFREEEREHGFPILALEFDLLRSC